MIKILADSTCDLSKELVEKYQIGILPLHILLGDKEYLDGVEIQPDEIYEWSDANKETPKTSAIGFEETFERLKPFLESDDEAVAFTISGKMSTTVNVLRMVVEELGLEDRVKIVDSENLSTGNGLLVLHAATMAAEGKNLQEIYDEILTLKSKVRASFVVDTLTYLHRGGRCSSVEALAGGALKLHPKIVVEAGKMGATKKYRGKMNKVIMDYVSDLEEEIKSARKARAFITHSGCDQELIDQVRNHLEELHHFDEILVTRAGGVISSHCGPGTLGVLFLSE